MEIVLLSFILSRYSQLKNQKTEALMKLQAFSGFRKRLPSVLLPWR